MLLHLIDLLLGNRKSELFLCLCQSNPQSSPGRELEILGKNVLHLFACITLGKRAAVTVCCAHKILLPSCHFRVTVSDSFISGAFITAVRDSSLYDISL